MARPRVRAKTRGERVRLYSSQGHFLRLISLAEAESERKAGRGNYFHLRNASGRILERDYGFQFRAGELDRREQNSPTTIKKSEIEAFGEFKVRVRGAKPAHAERVLLSMMDCDQDATDMRFGDRAVAKISYWPFASHSTNAVHIVPRTA